MRHNRFTSPVPVCFKCLSDNVQLIAKGGYDQYLCKDCGAEWEIDDFTGEPVFL